MYILFQWGEGGGFKEKLPKHRQCIPVLVPWILGGWPGSACPAGPPSETTDRNSGTPKVISLKGLPPTLHGGTTEPTPALGYGNGTVGPRCHTIKSTVAATGKGK